MSRLTAEFSPGWSRIAGEPRARERSVAPFGHARIDDRIGGGLERATLHEVFASADDAGAGTAFALLLGLLGCSDKPIMWVREARCRSLSGRLYPPGLAELGARPEKLFLVETADARATLRAAADIVRCGEVGTAIIEQWGRAAMFDLTASRRLVLAAERSGVTALLLRIDATPEPSAARTRWSVAAAPSASSDAELLGHPAFDVTLLRHRGGAPGFDARVEWNRDRRCFGEPPLSGAGLPLVAGGTGAGDALRAA